MMCSISGICNPDVPALQTKHRGCELIKIKKRPYSRQVFPWGVEPQSLEPESNILSIELREHFLSKHICLRPYFTAKLLKIA